MSLFLWPFGIVGPIIVFLALREIKRTGEKGRWLAILSLALWFLSMLALYVWGALWSGNWLWFLG